MSESQICGIIEIPVCREAGLARGWVFVRETVQPEYSPRLFGKFGCCELSQLSDKYKYLL